MSRLQAINRAASRLREDQPGHIFNEAGFTRAILTQ